MKRGWVAAVLGLAVTVSVLGLAKGGDAAAGKAVYDKKCAICHGKSGEGNAAVAKALKVELHHLGAKEVQAKTDDELRRTVAEGVGKMKPVTGLSNADLANLLAYLRTLKQS